MRRWLSPVVFTVAVCLVPSGPAVAEGVGAAGASSATAFASPEATFAWPVGPLTLGAAAQVGVTGVGLVVPTTVTLREGTDSYDTEGPVLATAVISPDAPSAVLPVPTDRVGLRHLYVEALSSDDWLGFVGSDQFDIEVVGLPSTITAQFPSATYTAWAGAADSVAAARVGESVEKAGKGKKGKKDGKSKKGKGKKGAKPKNQPPPKGGGGSMGGLVTGTVSGTPGRPVFVQAQGANGTWVTLAETTSRPDGSFTAQAPIWWVAEQTLRAYAPPTAVDAEAATTNTGRIVVKRGFTPVGGSAFSYLMETKARWNPCQVITYRVNPSRMPKGGLAEVAKAFGAVSEASGLRFRYVGETAFVPFRKGQSPFASVEDADFAVAWATPTAVPGLAGGTVGLGGAKNSGGELYDGGVVFDAATRLRGYSTKAAKDLWLAIMMHEVAHAVGLGHVNDKRQTMYPSAQPRPEFGRGDLRGLVDLGAGNGCVEDSVRTPAA